MLLTNKNDKTSLDTLTLICYNSSIIKKGVSMMFWKMTNVQLTKGSIFPIYGDSAPFYKVICQKEAQI